MKNDNGDLLRSFNQFGWVVIPEVVDGKTTERIANTLKREAMQFLLHGEEAKQVEAIQAALPGDKILQLITDPKLREKHLAGGSKAAWHNGNPHTPIISKSTGMFNRTNNPEVADAVLMNPTIVDTITSLYRTFPAFRDRDPRLAYCLGRDRICIKPKGATAMELHLDHHLFKDTPYPHRIQALCTLSIGGQAGDAKTGSLQVLQGFHRLRPLARIFFRSRLPDAVATGSRIPQPLGKPFIDLLPAFRTWLAEQVASPADMEIKTAMEDCGGAAEVTDALATLRFVVPPVRPGSLVCWHHDLPHCNMANASDTPRIAAFITLLPAGEALTAGEGDQIVLQRFLGQRLPTHSGSNRATELEEKIFGPPKAPTWTLTSRRVLLLAGTPQLVAATTPMKKRKERASKDEDDDPHAALKRVLVLARIRLGSQAIMPMEDDNF